MQKKTVLVMGATGSMGRYVVPELLRLGYRVDALSKDEMTSDNPDLTYYTLDCFDDEVMGELLKKHYDGIIDFMVYTEERIGRRLPMYLENTDHYIFMSSYRVYGNEQVPVTEEAPRLSEALRDEAFLATSNYALQKCRCEDVFQNSKYTNWSIARPVIVFSGNRFPLITLETATVLNRIKAGKTVLLPAQAKDVHAAMIWGGDAGRLLANLLFKKDAMRECFTIATGESMTWGDFVSYIEEFLGMKSRWIDKEEHLEIMSDDPATRQLHRWGLEYDRLYDRNIDSSKVVRVSGVDKNSFTSVKEGLRYELSLVTEDAVWEERGIHLGVSERMDRYLAEH